MSGGIFLTQSDGELVAMTQQAYDSEDVLRLAGGRARVPCDWVRLPVDRVSSSKIPLSDGRLQNH